MFIELPIYGYIAIATMLFIDNKWEIPVESIRITTKLGKGEFGHLYDAELMTSNGTLMRALVKASIGSCGTDNSPLILTYRLLKVEIIIGFNMKSKY